MSSGPAIIKKEIRKIRNKVDGGSKNENEEKKKKHKNI